MKITDINGKELIVTDLNSALMQAREFVNLQHTDEQFKQLDAELKSYWQDVVNKLEALQIENDKK
ncbi:MAG TPA: hypothetical protein VG738_18655 [Chitinophagaceae bacterium]|nr:hypothetical protein [Chitinophagaceae bacterium]